MNSEIGHRIQLTASNHNPEYPKSVNAKATSVRRAEPTMIYECDIQWKYDDTKRLNQYSQNVEHE